jgi:hypothetical protein
MRVYVPATSTVLRSLLETGMLGSPPTTAFAVTPGLREWYTDDDIEELEYAAMMESARASLRLLATDPSAGRRRVVVAADVGDADVSIRDDIDVGVVSVGVAIPLAACACVHADDMEAADVVERAASLVDAADVGDADAEDAVDDAEGFELSWFATQELSMLLEEFD